MGSSVSKAMTPIDRLTTENVAPTVPISTPQIKRLDLDPRSPSCDISRTPIEVLRTPLGNSKKTSLNDDLYVTTDDEEVIQLNLDPRSPTTEFHRTPIVVPQSPKAQPIALHNKNLDNARMRDVVGTPAQTTKNLNHVTRRIYKSPIPPKLIDSSPILIVPATNKRNSVVGLLETNLDFVETDLDNVIQSKRERSLKEVEELEVSNEVKEELPYEKIETDVDQVENEEELSQTKITEINDDVTSASNIIKETDNNPSMKCEENEPKVPENEINQVNETKLIKEEEVPEITTPKRIATLNVNSTNEKCDDILPAKHNALIKVEKITRASTAVDELDRKLSNLIYEDRQCESSPRTRKLLSSQPQKTRTPLSDRNINHQRKSIPVLKVSDKPTTKGGKISLSKIPVFKEKQTRKVIQCENTEPNIIPRKSQWSTEDSLLI